MLGYMSTSSSNSVTFNVDMNNETINGNVYLIGNFQLFPWSTSILPTVMTDDDGDGIYSVTVDTGIFSDDLIEYKFVNGAIVETDEGIGNCGNFRGFCLFISRT